MKTLINICRVVVTIIAVSAIVGVYLISTLGSDYASFAVHELPYLAILSGLAVGVWLLPIK